MGTWDAPYKLTFRAVLKCASVSRASLIGVTSPDWASWGSDDGSP